MKIYFNGHTIYPNEEAARKETIREIQRWWNFEKEQAKAFTNRKREVKDIKEKIIQERHSIKHKFYFNYYDDLGYGLICKNTTQRSYSIKEVN